MRRNSYRWFLTYVLVGLVGFVPAVWGQTGAAPAEVRLADGDVFDLSAAPLRQRIGSVEFNGMAYNGGVPGPTLRVSVGSTITVRFRNELDEPTTVHWHGLRHDIRFDGVPGVSQEPVPSGGEFDYRLTFKDPGVFWYHPHVREDRQQDLGLYGVILVEDPARVPEVDREVVLVVNDLLTDGNRVVPHGRDSASHALMGRFGDLIVVNGQERSELEAREGELVRFYILNTASARPYNLSLPGHSMTVVAGDLGPFARPYQTDSVLVAPAERYVVDVLFARAGSVPIVHRSPEGSAEMASVRVLPNQSRSTSDRRVADAAGDPVSDAVMRRALTREPDYSLEMDLEMGHMGRGMMAPRRSMTGPMGGTAGHGAMHHGATANDEFPAGIEWEDGMPMMNAASTSRSLRWVLRDTETYLENEEIRMTARVGDTVTIRLTNRDDSAHPMHHPIHLHGQRFVVLSVDGRPNDNPVWKDTVLVPAGATVDIMVEVTEPGEWMLHCHIPEHLEAGMMTFLSVGR